MTSRKRLNLAITRATNDRLKKVQKLSGSDSATEAIRRSLAVYEELLLTQLEGGKIVLRDKEGEDVVLKIVW